MRSHAPLLFALVLLATGCQTTGPDDDTPGEVTTTDPTATLTLDVGVEGGILEHPLATVILPPYAFGDRSGTVTLTPVDEGPEGFDLTGLGFTVDFGGRTLENEARILAHRQDDFKGEAFLRLWSTFTGEHFAFDQMITDGEGQVKPGDFELTRTEGLTVLFADKGVHTQAFDAEPAQVDILLVINNNSAGLAQATFAEAVPELWDILADSPVDAHIGVIDMDTDEPQDGSFLAGQLMSHDGLRWVTPDTPQGAETLQDLVLMYKYRNSGPHTRAFAATRAALVARSSDANTGFRRPNGSLEVVFVSDSDDESGSSPSANQLQIIMEGLVPSPYQFRAHAASGPAHPSGCGGDGGTATGSPRLHSIVDNTDGLFWPICDPEHVLDFGEDITADMAASTCVPLDHERQGSFSITEAVSGQAIDPVHVRLDNAANCAWLTVRAYDDLDPAQPLLAHYQLGRP